MGTYSLFNTFGVDAVFKTGVIDSFTDNLIDVTIEEVQWEKVAWRYNCPGNYEPESAQLPYHVGDTVVVEWDQFNEEPKAVVGFPDGARACVAPAILIHSDGPPPFWRAQKLEVWINDVPIVVSYDEEDGSTLDPPRNYRLFSWDMAHGFDQFGEEGSTGRIIDIQFARNYPYRIAVLIQNELVDWGYYYGKIPTIGHLVIVYNIDPATMELSVSEYYGLPYGGYNCRGGCDDTPTGNSDFCPGLQCLCGSDGWRNGCYACSGYFNLSTATDSTFAGCSRTYFYNIYQSSHSSRSCGTPCCANCGFTVGFNKVFLLETGEPYLLATSRHIADIRTPPSGPKSYSIDFDHPVELHYHCTGEIAYGGIHRIQEYTTSYNIISLDPCYTGQYKSSYNIHGYYYPNTSHTFSHVSGGSWSDVVVAAGACTNYLNHQLEAAILRANASAFDCSYAHNVYGDYRTRLPYVQLASWSQVAGDPSSDNATACLNPGGMGCNCTPSWAASYTTGMMLDIDTYYYIRYEQGTNSACESERSSDYGDLKCRNLLDIDPGFTDPERMTPRWALHSEIPDISMVWGRVSNNSIFKSFTNVFAVDNTLQTIRCKQGQTNPDCYSIVGAVDETYPPYYAEEVGVTTIDKHWSIFVSPSTAGFIVGYFSGGSSDFQFYIYAYHALAEDTPGSGLIVHPISYTMYKAYESTYLEPKGHALCIYDPTL